MREQDIPKGRKLNEPFPNDKEGFSVYAKNKGGEVILVRFSGEPSPFQSTDPTTPQYWNEKQAGLKTKFKHTAFFDATTRRVRSVRDGVQEYYGFELDLEPRDKVFSLYRSAETISNIAAKLKALPVTNEHVEANDVSDVAELDKIGALEGTEVIELHDESTSSSLCLENLAGFTDEGLELVKAGKKQFSLGYTGKLKEHDVYDFEQFNIKPTHLALVDSARGGSVLTFADKEGNNMTDKAKKLNKVFLDAEGAPNLQQIVEIAGEALEALKTAPQDKVMEFIPMFKELIALGKSGDSAEDDTTAISDEDKEAAKEEGKKEMLDSDMEEMKDEDKKAFGDSKLYKSIIAAQSKSFADSDVFKKTVEEKTKAHASVIQKASDFLDSDYNFADKSTEQIMADALQKEHGDNKFEDSELAIAFKLLKRSGSELHNFGDSTGKTDLEKRIEKELGE